MERHGNDAVSGETSASPLGHSKHAPAPTIDALFRHMAETVQDVFWLSTPDLKTLIYANPAFERVWGQPRDAALQPPAAIVNAAHPDDFSRVFKEISSVRETPRDIDYRIVRPDGSIRWVRNRVHGIYDDGGRLAMLAGAAADITEHKLFQKSLIDSHARFITVLDSMDADIYVADFDYARDPLCEPAHSGKLRAGSHRKEMLGRLSKGNGPLPGMQQSAPGRHGRKTLRGSCLGRKASRHRKNVTSTTTVPLNGSTVAWCACRLPPTSPA